VTGFAAAPTAALEAVRGNLLAGLDRVTASLDDGTFAACGPKGAAPPAQSGHLTLALLAGVDAELGTRTDRSTA
jgi:hypothetical protein